MLVTLSHSVLYGIDRKRATVSGSEVKFWDEKVKARIKERPEKPRIVT